MQLKLLLFAALAAVASATDAAGSKWLAEKKAEAGVISTGSGLMCVLC